MIKALVFLGNPGRKYVKTRHNAAWLFCDYTYGSVVWSEKFRGKTAEVAGITGPLRLLKPETFMNRSGISVRAMIQFYKYSSEEVLVIHDSLETPFGSWVFRPGGGTRGHNGLKSIRDSLGHSDFPRIGIGIGHKRVSNTGSFVLKPFNALEQNLLDDVFRNMRNFMEDPATARTLPDKAINIKVVETE